MFVFTTIRKWLSGLVDWLKAAHSENQGPGAPSFARLAQGLIVYNTIGWVWYSLIKNHGQIPDLGGPTMFLTGGAASHYGINQIKTWAGKGGVPDHDSILNIPPNNHQNEPPQQ